MAASQQVSFNNIPVWLDSNKEHFVPPVCNKLMHGPDGQLFVMYVGGPNMRKDFHMEEGEELFYMVKGMMHLKVLEHGEFHDIQIREGDIFLLPARIPHSPQRFENTVGLVIERKRMPQEKDCIRYYVEGTADVLFERWLQCENLGTQIAEVITEFFASPEYGNGKPQEQKTETPPPYLPDGERDCPDPFNLVDMLNVERLRMEKEGKVRLFETVFQTDVFAVGGHNPVSFEANPEAETWVWQVKGSANFVHNEGGPSDLRSVSYLLAEDTAFLVKKGDSFEIQPQSQGEDDPSFTLVVTMDPRNKDRSSKT